MYKNKNGDEFVRCEAYEQNYNFKLTEETRDADKLKKMIENLEKSRSGFFVRYGKHEYFIPHILKETPDILKHRHAVENGNAPLEINEEAIAAKDMIQSQVQREIDAKDLKVIKYLKRTVDGFDGNNLVETAYSYFDKIKNDRYLYVPDRKRIQVFIDDFMVKKIKL